MDKRNWPARGSKWKHPKHRHIWKIVSVGPVAVTLKADFPGVRPMKVPTVSWPTFWGGPWELVAAASKPNQEPS